MFERDMVYEVQVSVSLHMHIIIKCNHAVSNIKMIISTKLKAVQNNIPLSIRKHGYCAYACVYVRVHVFILVYV